MGENLFGHGGDESQRSAGSNQGEGMSSRSTAVGFSAQWKTDGKTVGVWESLRSVFRRRVWLVTSKACKEYKCTLYVG